MGIKEVIALEPVQKQVEGVALPQNGGEILPFDVREDSFDPELLISFLNILYLSPGTQVILSGLLDNIGNRDGGPNFEDNLRTFGQRYRTTELPQVRLELMAEIVEHYRPQAINILSPEENFIQFLDFFGNLKEKYQGFVVETLKFKKLVDFNLNYSKTVAEDKEKAMNTLTYIMTALTKRDVYAAAQDFTFIEDEESQNEVINWVTQIPLQELKWLDIVEIVRNIRVAVERSRSNGLSNREKLLDNKLFEGNERVAVTDFSNSTETQSKMARVVLDEGAEQDIAKASIRVSEAWAEIVTAIFDRFLRLLRSDEVDVRSTYGDAMDIASQGTVSELLWYCYNINEIDINQIATDIFSKHFDKIIVEKLTAIISGMFVHFSIGSGEVVSKQISLGSKNAILTFSEAERSADSISGQAGRGNVALNAEALKELESELGISLRKVATEQSKSDQTFFVLNLAALKELGLVRQVSLVGNATALVDKEDFQFNIDTQLGAVFEITQHLLRIGKLLEFTSPKKRLTELVNYLCKLSEQQDTSRVVSTNIGFLFFDDYFFKNAYELIYRRNGTERMGFMTAIEEAIHTMALIIEEHGGEIDKHIEGSKFGLMFSIKDPLQAARAMLRIQKEIETFKAKLQPLLGQENIQGIYSGLVDGTAISDTILLFATLMGHKPNEASRLAAYAKKNSMPFLALLSICKKLEGLVEYSAIKPIEAKGIPYAIRSAKITKILADQDVEYTSTTPAYVLQFLADLEQDPTINMAWEELAVISQFIPLTGEFPISAIKSVYFFKMLSEHDDNHLVLPYIRFKKGGLEIKADGIDVQQLMDAVVATTPYSRQIRILERLLPSLMAEESIRTRFPDALAHIHLILAARSSNGYTQKALELSLASLKEIMKTAVNPQETTASIYNEMGTLTLEKMMAMAVRNLVIDLTVQGKIHPGVEPLYKKLMAIGTLNDASVGTIVDLIAYSAGLEYAGENLAFNKWSVVKLKAIARNERHLKITSSALKKIREVAKSWKEENTVLPYYINKMVSLFVVQAHAYHGFTTKLDGDLLSEKLIGYLTKQGVQILPENATDILERTVAFTKSINNAIVA